MGERSEVNRDVLLEVYKAQWADIHHSRHQDWELVKVVLAGFLGLSGLIAFTKAILLLRLLSVSLMVLSIVGVLITVRHKHLFREKMDAIRKLEGALSVDTLALFAPKPSGWWLRHFTTQNFLIAIYTLSALLFAAFLFCPVAI